MEPPVSVILLYLSDIFVMSSLSPFWHDLSLSLSADVIILFLSIIYVGFIVCVGRFFFVGCIFYGVILMANV